MYNIKIMKQVKKKHQFQIRKVPLKRFIPQKTPQLYALDVHSICLPSKKKNWASLHHNGNQRNYEQEFNRQIMSSKAYQQLYSQYVKLREQRMKQKIETQNEIENINNQLQQKKQKHQQLISLRDGFYTQIQTLRDELTEHRDKNYNLRWEVYNQRGTQYANLYGYSFLDPHELTYEELLQIEEQIGSVNRGLSLQEIEQLQKSLYTCPEGGQRQICCICYDEIGNEEWVTMLVCKHTHHCECIKDWLLKQKICPICKKEVQVSEYKRVKNVSREDIENPQI